ncbi:CoA-transferase family III domain-containing protein [Aspergillus ambiguus]|uniref:CaiB/BaiF CoA transferase family protein n=1 Tax=Aspergillus ambiguus TaxID=176160 RepID=UPI003CCDF237
MTPIARALLRAKPNSVAFKYSSLTKKTPIHKKADYSSIKPEPTGPLEGVRVLDLTRVLAGPFCTQILADYGAKVIKVEQPDGGDETRLWKEPGEEKLWRDGTQSMSLYFNTINRNKKSISVNLKHESGKKVILDLIKQSDVVVDNFIPGKLEQLGLGYDVFKSANPSIIHASISGYGATGPYAKRAGYDVIAASEAGLLHITGEPNGPPTKLGVGIMDICTGLYLHGSICAALVARKKTGKGQKIDASLFETTISILSNVGMSWLNLGKEGRRWGNSHPSIVPYDAFKTKDSLLVIGAVNNRQFKAMCKYLGKPELADDPRFVDNDARLTNRVELKQILDTLFAAKTTSHWLEVFQKSGLPHGPVNTLEQAFSHPQVAARQMVQSVEQSASVSGKLSVLGIPVKFSETPGSIRSEPPSLGGNTDEVLRELYTEEDIAQLRKDGVI